MWTPMGSPVCCGCLRWVELLGAGLAAVAVNAVALLWKLAQMDFLTIRVEMPIHHGLIVLQDADVAVVVRQASATDCDVVHLVDPVMLSMPD